MVWHNVDAKHHVYLLTPGTLIYVPINYLHGHEDAQKNDSPTPTYAHNWDGTKQAAFPLHPPAAPRTENELNAHGLVKLLTDFVTFSVKPTQCGVTFYLALAPSC